MFIALIVALIKFLVPWVWGQYWQGSFFDAIEKDNTTLMELEILIWPELVNGPFISSTPLKHAVSCNSVNAAKVLIKHKADINFQEQNPSSYSALHLAAYSDKTEFVKILLENGGDPNTKGFWHLRPIYLSVMSNNIEAVNLFIKHGANLNVQDDDGVTPLGYAADEDMVRILLENGADPSIRDNDNKTVKDYLVEERVKANDKEKIRIDKMIKIIEKYEKPQKK